MNLVCANLHAELVVALADDLIRVVGRHLVVAGILEDREEMARLVLDPALTVQHRTTDGPWVCLWYSRPLTDHHANG